MNIWDSPAFRESLVQAFTEHATESSLIAEESWHAATEVVLADG